jgi:hypothetical protein
MGRSTVQASTADNSAPCARASAAVALIARPLTALHAAKATLFYRPGNAC